MAHRQADRACAPAGLSQQTVSSEAASPLRTAPERLAWNAALDRAAKIAGPQYSKADPGQWSREKHRLASEINACKLKIAGA